MDKLNAVFQYSSGRFVIDHEFDWRQITDQVWNEEFQMNKSNEKLLELYTIVYYYYTNGI